MVDRFRPGDRVVVVQRDVATHTRAPRYVRGRVGVVAEVHGHHPVPDSVVAGDQPPASGAVYAVRFAAHDLFGAGDHTVTVNLWDHYLEAEEETP